VDTSIRFRFSHFFLLKTNEVQFCSFLVKKEEELEQKSSLFQQTKLLLLKISVIFPPWKRVHRVNIQKLA